MPWAMHPCERGGMPKPYSTPQSPRAKRPSPAAWADTIQNWKRCTNYKEARKGEKFALANNSSKPIACCRLCHWLCVQLCIHCVSLLLLRPCGEDRVLCCLPATRLYLAVQGIGTWWLCEDTRRLLPHCRLRQRSPAVALHLSTRSAATARCMCLAPGSSGYAAALSLPAKESGQPCQHASLSTAAPPGSSAAPS